jgi:hypothetical protein
MFSWFKDKEINRISFDVTDWKIREKTSEIKIWDKDCGEILSLNFFDKKPDIPVSLTQIDELRSFYRNLILEAGGGIIKIETIKIKGIDAVECIFKIPMQPSGVTYVGSFTFPFRDKSYVLKFQCAEQGITGQRDAIIFAVDSNFDFDNDNENIDPFKDWAKDPYDETFTEGLLMNLSESEKYDEKFPNHPLTRLRKHIKQVKQTINFGEKLHNLHKFE